MIIRRQMINFNILPYLSQIHVPVPGSRSHPSCIARWNTCLRVEFDQTLICSNVNGVYCELGTCWVVSTLCSNRADKIYIKVYGVSFYNLFPI